MTSHTIVSHVQEALSQHRDIDGWLFYEYKGRNRMVLDLFGVPQLEFVTRRFFFWVPAIGDPIKIVHTVDESLAGYFTGKTMFYSSWRELEAILFSLLKPGHTIAMEYWPSELLPSQSLLDASTTEWFERQGVHITSSWPLLSSLIGHLSSHQKDLFRDAVQSLGKSFEHAWSWLKESLGNGRHITEKNLQEILINAIHSENAIFDHPPIVAVQKNSTSPHHVPGETSILPDSMVLIDAWCKKNDPHAPYADFTQVAFTGRTPPEMTQKIFSVVKEAQETAIRFIDVCLQNGCAIPGAEVDMACRYVIDSHGFGNYFPHRTGHNIFLDVHGPGANLDNYESRDSRHLIPNGCYSIEPGIYLPNAFGIRLECNILIDSSSTCSVFGKAPNTIRCLY